MIAAHRAIKRAGLKTGCITNNFPSIESDGSAQTLGEDSRLHSIYRQFDHVIESTKVGLRKPEPRIYEMMIEALGVSAADCIFLDDLGVNLKPARAMGMMTIKVPFGDVAPAINELMELLKLPSLPGAT